jgi:hypothetical protein
MSKRINKMFQNHDQTSGKLWNHCSGLCIYIYALQFMQYFLSRTFMRQGSWFLFSSKFLFFRKKWAQAATNCDSDAALFLGGYRWFVEELWLIYSPVDDEVTLRLQRQVKPPPSRFEQERTWQQIATNCDLEEKGDIDLLDHRSHFWSWQRALNWTSPSSP